VENDKTMSTEIVWSAVHSATRTGKHRRNQLVKKTGMSPQQLTVGLRLIFRSCKVFATSSDCDVKVVFFLNFKQNC